MHTMQIFKYRNLFFNFLNIKIPSISQSVTLSWEEEVEHQNKISRNCDLLVCWTDPKAL